MDSKRPGLKSTVPFKISSMDGLGQGVSKVTDKITFVEKTLPGDEGTAEILAQRKGVAFARKVVLEKNSELRQVPVCPHFENCPSCHYLHTGYETELAMKVSALERLFFKIPHPPVKVIGAPRRTGYRNRIQLHYDLNSGLMGMLDARQNTLVEVPLCKIGDPVVTGMLKEFYSGKWQDQAAKTSPRGHVELYNSPEGPKISWNRPYADGGFTQVFPEMNERLKLELINYFSHSPPFELLDLFAGNGNLSEKLNYSKRLCVDVYNRPIESPFINQDLYADSALTKIQREIENKNMKTEVLLLDPPRSGHKDLPRWVKVLDPSIIAYVSCDPNTLARDLAALTDHKITSLWLLDFFPSTFHFETMVILERK